MRAGTLRHRITITQSPDVRGATFGDPQPAFVPFAANLPARVSPVGGREAFNNRIVSAAVDHIIEVRYLSGVKPQMQVNFGTRTFRIEAITNEDERRVHLTLQCVELVQ